MKTIKRFFLFTFLILIIPLKGNSMGNNLFRGDTVRIDYKSLLIEVATSDLKKNSIADANIPRLVDELQKALENVTFNNSNKNFLYVVRYSNLFGGLKKDFYELSLETKQKTADKMIINEGTVLLKSKGNIILELENINYFIRIYLDDIRDTELIKTPEFSVLLSDADSQISRTKKRLNGWMILNNEGSFNAFFLNEMPPLTNDILELTAGVGSGWIKNEFVSNFHFRVGLGFAGKGILRNKYYAEIEAFYDFSGNGTFVNNGFLSVGYEKNFSGDPGKDKWYGLSVGFLIDRNNDFFSENTFKLSVNKRLNNSFSVKPEIYFNGFFKNMYPGIRLSVSF